MFRALSSKYRILSSWCLLNGEHVKSSEIQWFLRMLKNPDFLIFCESINFTLTAWANQLNVEYNEDSPVILWVEWHLDKLKQMA